MSLYDDWDARMVTLVAEVMPPGVPIHLHAQYEDDQGKVALPAVIVRREDVRGAEYLDDDIDGAIDEVEYDLRLTSDDYEELAGMEDAVLRLAGMAGVALVEGGQDVDSVRAEGEGATILGRLYTVTVTDLSAYAPAGEG